MVSLPKPLDFHFLSAYSMRFIPMNFGVTNPSAPQADLCNSFHFPPSARAILFPETHDIAYSPTDSDSLNLFDFPDYLKIHSKRRLSY